MSVHHLWRLYLLVPTLGPRSLGRRSTTTYCHARSCNCGWEKSRSDGDVPRDSIRPVTVSSLCLKLFVRSHVHIALGNYGSANQNPFPHTSTRSSRPNLDSHVPRCHQGSSHLTVFQRELLDTPRLSGLCTPTLKIVSILCSLTLENLSNLPYLQV